MLAADGLDSRRRRAHGCDSGGSDLGLLSVAGLFHPQAMRVVGYQKGKDDGRRVRQQEEDRRACATRAASDPPCCHRQRQRTHPPPPSWERRLAGPVAAGWARRVREPRPRCCEAAAAHNLTTAGHRIAGPATRGAPRSSRRRAAARVRRLLATPKCPIPLSQFPSFRRVRGDFRGGWCSQVGTHKLVFSSMNTQTRKHLKGAWELTLHARACERPA